MMAFPEEFRALSPAIINLLFYGGVVVATVSLIAACFLAHKESKTREVTSVNDETKKPIGPVTIHNSGGGIGADISVTGTQGAVIPNVGMEVNGLHIVQSGPGIGMKVVVGGGNGPAVGVRSIVTRK